jgi:hypothetical protein
MDPVYTEEDVEELRVSGITPRSLTRASSLSTRRRTGGVKEAIAWIRRPPR